MRTLTHLNFNPTGRNIGRVSLIGICCFILLTSPIGVAISTVSAGSPPDVGNGDTSHGDESTTFAPPVSGADGGNTVRELLLQSDADSGDRTNSTADIDRWTPPPPPPGADLTPIEYLSLWGQQYTRNQTIALLEEAGYSDEEIDIVVAEYLDLVTLGTAHHAAAHQSKTIWNRQNSKYSVRTNESVSIPTTSTSRSSQTKDGPLWIADAQHDMSAIGPSTTVLTGSDSKPTIQDQSSLYIAGETIFMRGLFDYRIEEPDDDVPDTVIGGSERTIYEHSETRVNGPYLTLEMDDGRTFESTGQTNDSTNSASATLDIPDNLSGAGTLTSVVETEVVYTETTEVRVCTSDEIEDPTDDGSSNDTNTTNTTTDNFTNSSNGPTAETNINPPTTAGGLVGESRGANCYWEEVVTNESTETVTVSNTEDVIIGNGDTVTVDYWEPKTDTGTGYYVVDLPAYWSSIRINENTVISSPQDIFTEADLKYVTQKFVTSDDTDFKVTDFTPVRTYLLGASPELSMSQGGTIDDSGGTATYAITRREGKSVTQYPPYSSTQSDRQPRFFKADRIVIAAQSTAADPDPDWLPTQFEARGVAPGQELDTKVNRAGTVVQSNVTAKYVQSPDDNGTALKITVLEEGSGTPIDTSAHENVDLIVDPAGGESYTVHSGSDGRAMVPVDNTTTVNVQIESEFDSSESLYIEPDSDTASAVPFEAAFYGAFTYIVYILLIIFPVLVFIAVLEFAVYGKIELMGLLT